VLGLRSEIR